MTLARVVPAPDDDPDDGIRRALDESFLRLLEENYLTLVKTLSRQYGDPHLAEDALQEALIVAMDKWDRVSRKEKPLLWVRKVAWNKLHTLYRRQHYSEQIPLDDVTSPIAEPRSSHEAEEALRHALRRLPERQRAVLILAIEGDSDDEIAYQLGLARNTVRTYKSDARKKCREFFQDGGDLA